MSAPENPQLNRVAEIGIAIITFDADDLYQVTCKCEYTTRPFDNGARAVEVADHFDFLVEKFGQYHSHPKLAR